MAEPIHILDDYYLSITLLITIGYQLAFFAIAFSFKFDKLTGMAMRSPPIPYKKFPPTNSHPQTSQEVPTSSSSPS